MPKLTVAAATLLVAVLGLAQPSAAQPAPAPPRDGAPLDEITAFLLSFGGTALSWGVLIGAAESGRWEVALVGATGTYLGPSFGHWYRGQILTRGLGVRTVGAGLFVLGGMKMFDDCEGEDCVNRTWALVALGGIVSYVLGTADDVITAPLEVRQHNKRLEVVGVGPMAIQGGTGLSLVGRF